MIKLLKLSTIVWIISIFIFSACSGNLSQTVLFEDEFKSLPIGAVDTDSAEYMTSYFMPGYAKLGPWTLATIFDDERFRNAWEIIEGDQVNFLRQNSHLVDEAKDLSYPHAHPILIGGDSIWHDYKIEFEFSPDIVMDKCGVIFKVQNSRCFYYYGMEGNKLVIKMMKHASFPHRPFEQILAYTNYNWEAGKLYSGDISIRENKIYSLLNDSIILIAEDDTYSNGKVGILSDVPASFYSMKVSTLSREKRKMNRVKHQNATSKAIQISENPMPIVWKRIGTSGYGAGRNLRFGDLNFDGDVDILIGRAKAFRGKRDYNKLLSLTAINTKGEVLWQKGSPEADDQLTVGDLPFQIHDLDGDGVREVICVMDFYLNILDGKDGKRINRMRTPGIGNHIESIFFMDFLGKGRDSDIVLMDWDNNIWIYDEHLKLLWNSFDNSGNYPSAVDIDGNGKDELLMGYKLFSDSGELIWDIENEVSGSLNSSAILKRETERDSFGIVYGAGDWGALFVDINANLENHYSIGNVQSILQVNLLDESEGLEMVSVNFWNNFGILNFYDASGNIYHSSNSGGHGVCMPVNWKGDGEEYLIFNTNPGDGGMLNAYGQVVVVFPDDGHPDQSTATYDITGDSRDEVICWDANEIWIYTQQDNPRQGKVYRPKRNPAYNYSNYQTFISEPGWND